MSSPKRMTPPTSPRRMRPRRFALGVALSIRTTSFWPTICARVGSTAVTGPGWVVDGAAVGLGDVVVTVPLPGLPVVGGFADRVATTVEAAAFAAAVAMRPPDGRVI